MIKNQYYFKEDYTREKYYWNSKKIFQKQYTVPKKNFQELVPFWKTALFQIKITKFKL